MELMDRGSLAGLLGSTQPLDPDVIAGEATSALFFSFFFIFFYNLRWRGSLAGLLGSTQPLDPDVIAGEPT